MRNIFSIMLLWLCQTALFAQYGGVNGDFNPQNPANPQSGGVLYGLTVRTQSENAGTTNVTFGELAAGESIHLYAYPSTGYEFKEWRRDDKVQSTLQDFTFTMPANNVTLTAVFTFNPKSPDNPGANDWDKGSSTLIIDDFKVGGLAEAIQQATNGDYNSVKTLIVSGNINDYDLGSLVAFKTFEVIDLSRCYGADTIPAYYFQNNTTLKEISLPASIKVFEDYAFMGCSSLVTLNMYSTVPPALGTDVFDFDRSNLKIHVPEESTDLYLNAAGWKDVSPATINGLGAKVYSLEIDLPDDYSDGRYNNMYVELKSATSDQATTLLITSGVQAYTFRNLRPDTKWTVSVKNASGQVLGTINDIVIGEADQVKKFESLIVPQTITAKVLTPNDNDVTGQVTLTWLNATGDYLGRGASIANVLPLEGATVTLRIALSEDLTMEYETPDDYTYSVQASDNVIEYKLTALEKLTLTGKVIDQDTNEGIAGASVIVAQTLYNRYTKNFKATTNDEGVYTIVNAYNAPATVTASATDYTSATASYDAGVTSLTDIKLKSLKSETNTVVTPTFYYVRCHEAGQDPGEAFFEDVQNVTYSIVNETRNYYPVTQFKVDGGKIVITEEVGEGDILTITAISKNGAFKRLAAPCEVIDGKASVDFTITQLGQIKASFVNSEATAAKAILYDSKGKFVTNADYDAESKSVLLADLPAGRYTLVSMSNSLLFNSIYDLSKFGENGLENGTDYVTSSVYVSDGIILPVTVPFVPYLDESKFDFMDSNTAFSVNKTLTTVGSNLTLTAFIAFKEMYAPYVSNVELVVDLDGCDFVEGSAMVGSAVCDATYDKENKQVVIAVDNLADRIRFCV